MFTLQLPRLISSAQSAVRSGRLGLQRHHTQPRFVYSDGTVCLIAAALPNEVLDAIVKNGHQRCAWLDLMRAGYFEVDGLDTVEALSALQLAYDACCVEDNVLRAKRTARLVTVVLSIDKDKASVCRTR
jgi:hypothetical protein